IVRRESSQFTAALKDHTQAIMLCTIQDELPRLYDQRRKTHMRSGNYRAALEDAEQYAVLRPEGLRFRVFCALLASGEYESAQAEYKRVAKLGTRPARFFKTKAEGYAFELLSTGQAFTLPPDIASKSPFYFMQQAAELHTLLKKKGRPLPISGGTWLGDWSPDGQQIAYWQYNAFSWLPGTMEGVMPESVTHCIEILDLRSGKTRPVTRFGTHPAWSPDGRHIAFRHKNDEQVREIWLVSLAGGEPRKLASGYRANWSQDSQRVFFRAEPKGTICSVDIDLPDADPVPVFDYPGHIFESFSISPDGSLIAIEISSEIRVLTFPKGDKVARWETPWPLETWATQLQWHPNGKTITLNSTSHYTQLGMCLFNVEQAEATHVLNLTRPWCRTMWSPDGSQLVVDPYSGKDVWLLDIDPGMSPTEALGPAMTTEEFLGWLLEKWDRRIEADPLSAENYVSRAVVSLAAKDYDRARQDIDHCGALINEPNDPACYAIWHWTLLYSKHGRHIEAEILVPHAEKLMDRFPAADVPSYRNLIGEIIKLNERRGKPELAARWRARLQELDKNNK
ncbi:MAG: PD40 domain-containing protein, partial [Planctomycetes bacterium]|nr:PD40 domain-containing protein [Planctomycetota bacterium]